MVEIAVDLVRIGDETIAHAEGALGDFDQTMDVLEAFGLADAQAIEQRQDHQRRQALRGRRRVVERAGSDRDAERLGNLGLVFLQIGARHRTADALEIGGNLAADVAAVEIAEAGLRELIERGGKGGLLELRARHRRFAVSQKGFPETDRVLHLRQFFRRQPRLTARHRVALARVFDRSRQQQIERQLAAVRFRRVSSKHPRRHRARHCERGERAARRNLVMAGVAIKLQRRLGASAPRAHDGAHAAGGLADQPEAVAADMVHVRIDRGDRRGHRDHRLDGVAAFGQDGAAVLDRGGVRGGDDAAAMAGAVQVHGVRLSMLQNVTRLG
jgi:hypothetical protein